MTILKERTSYETATNLFNLLVSDSSGDGQSVIGIKALYNAVQRTTHTKQKRKKISQATDLKLFWKEARLCYCAQYIACLGHTLPEETIEKLKSKNYDTNAYTFKDLKKEGLDLPKKFAIAFWDEIHFEQIAGKDREHNTHSRVENLFFFQFQINISL